MNDNQEPQQTEHTIDSVQDLFQQARASSKQKGLNPSSAEILIQNLNPTTLAGTQGVSYEVLSSDKAFLFVPVIDMTGSMEAFRQEVIHAYNGMLQALKDSKQADAILMSSWTFNTDSYLLHGYTPLEYVPELERHIYQPTEQTALYDAILDAITGVVAYGQELRNAGARTRITLVIFTDGHDNASHHSARQVRKVIEDLLISEMYTFALIGFGSGFAQKIAKDLGIPNVMEARADAEEIRRAVSVVSRSVIRASQTVVSSQQGGFFS